MSPLSLASRVPACFFSLSLPHRGHHHENMARLAHRRMRDKWGAAKPASEPQPAASDPLHCDQSQPRRREQPRGSPRGSSGCGSPGLKPSVIYDAGLCRH